MKKEYEQKKKQIILTLALVALFLAGALGFFLYRQGKATVPVVEGVEEEIVKPQISVPEISVPDGNEGLSKKEGSTETGEEQEGDLTVQTSKDEEGADAGKPKTKEEAEAPKEKPQVEETAEEGNPDEPPQYAPEVTNPDPKPEEPSGGSTNENGQIYVPGFGYVDDPGAPVSETAGSDGDWNKQIGDM